MNPKEKVLDQQAPTSLDANQEVLRDNPLEKQPDQAHKQEVVKLQNEIQDAEQKFNTPLVIELGGKANSMGVEIPPDSMARLKAKDTEIENAHMLIVLKSKEEEYLLNHPAVVELEERYNSKESHPTAMLGTVAEFANKVGVPNATTPELVGKKFSPEMKAQIFDKAKERITLYLANKETGRVNPAKHETLLKQTERYLDLIVEAQTEGDISSEVSAEDIERMVNENIDVLAYQDRVAAENLLGDHGIRHLVGHNINVSEKIFDELARNGQTVKAMDRLMMHQVMIDHDIGYAMSPVRDRINTEGIKGQDAGHNLLAGKFISERLGDKDDHLNKIFSIDALKQIHAGILNHDSSDTAFILGNDSSEARQKNLESAIHLADNTHAFEDKLPELLYEVPKSLEAMRLLKTAGEIGDNGLVDEIKNDLVEYIKNSEQFSQDDKDTLSLAVGGLSATLYKFSVPRICGNKPEFMIDKTGKVEITVTESAIHQEATALFNQDAYKQLQKFIKDLGGPKDVPMDTDTVETDQITFKLKKGAEASTERTDYQERMDRMINNEMFRSFVAKDTLANAQQKKIESLLGNPGGLELAGLENQLANIKNERKELLRTYLKNNNE